MSAVEEERYWAEARDRALSDEVTMLNAARREGREEGREEVARHLIALRLLTDEQIATAAGLTEAAVKALRDAAG